MATISWKSAISGNWWNTANWDLGRRPSGTDDVQIAVSGTYTITAAQKGDTHFGINSLTISDSNATVNISSGPAVISTNLTNAGTVSILNTTQIGLLTNGGLINSGTANLSAGDIEMSHLTNTGVLNVLGGSVTVRNDAIPSTLTSGEIHLVQTVVYFQGGGHLTSIGAGATLTVVGGGFDDAIGHPVNNELSLLSSNAGYLLFGDQAPITNKSVAFNNSGTYVIYNQGSIGTNSGVNYTNSGTVQIDTSHGQGASAFSIGGTFTNSGTLQIGASDNSLTATSTATVAHISNSGTIVLNGQHGHGWVNQAQLLDTGDAAPGTLSAGVSLTLTGASLLRFASGSINSIAAGASLSIDGAHAFVADNGQSTTNSALTGLASNAGGLTLSGGASINSTAVSFNNSGTLVLHDQAVFKTALEFTNSGQLNIDSASVQGGSTFKAGAAFHNSGTLNFGSATLATSNTMTVGALDNTGTIHLAGGSPGSSSALGVKGTFSNSGTLDVGTFSSISKISTFDQTAGQTDVFGSIAAGNVKMEGGLLQGTGTITGNVTGTGGEIAGGSFSTETVGTLNILGKFIDSATVDATIVAAGAGDASLIDVSGPKVSLKGATLHLDIVDPNNLVLGETFTIMDFTSGTLTFGFDTITDGTHTGDGSSLDLGNGLTLEATYDNAGGTIELTAVLTPSHAEILSNHFISSEHLIDNTHLTNSFLSPHESDWGLL